MFLDISKKNSLCSFSQFCIIGVLLGKKIAEGAFFNQNSRFSFKRPYAIFSPIKPQKCEIEKTANSVFFLDMARNILANLGQNEKKCINFMSKNSFKIFAELAKKLTENLAIFGENLKIFGNQ